ATTGSTSVMRGRIRMLSTVMAGITCSNRAGPATIPVGLRSLHADRGHDRGAGGVDLGPMVSDRGPGRSTGTRLPLALGPFLQPDGSSRATGTGMLVIADGAGATHAADSFRAVGQPHDLSPPCPAGADGGGRRRALRWA